MATKLNKCFICSPPHEGEPEKMAMANRYCRDAVWDLMVPVAPNLSFSAFLDDADISDRWRKKSIVEALLPECSEFRVFCDEVTEDMIPEIKRAQELKIPIKFYDADMKEVDYDALIINKRIGPGYRVTAGTKMDRFMYVSLTNFIRKQIHILLMLLQRTFCVYF